MRLPPFIGVLLALGLCTAAPAKQLVCHFNGNAPGSDVNEFAGATSPPPEGAQLSAPGTGFPGDGPQGRALDTGIASATPMTLKLPIARPTDLSQGTLEAWVNTGWDWGEDHGVHDFLFQRMEGGDWNSICIYYHGHMGDAQVLAFNINDGLDHAITYDAHKLGWKKGEWHHLAASWTRHSTCLFADGKLVNHATYAEPMSFTPPSMPLQVGAPGLSGERCGALMDEVHFTDAPLYVGCDSIPLAKTLLPDKLPIALSDGAEVTASSVAAPLVRVEDVPELHDGLYGKAVRVGQVGNAGEVLVTFKAPRRVAAVRWSRDGRRLVDGDGEKGTGWARTTDVPCDFTIETSPDGQAWTEVARKTGFFISPTELSGTGIRIRHDFAPVPARAVRMRITKGLPPGLGSSPMLDEFEVIEADTGSNLARDAVVATSHSIFRRAYSAAHLTDHRIGEENAWRAGKPGPAEVTLTLPQPAEVHSLEWSRSAEGLATDGTVQEMIIEGEVGGAWVELAHVTGNTLAVRQRTALKPITTRQIRLRIFSTTDGKEATLDEVALY